MMRELLSSASVRLDGQQDGVQAQKDRLAELGFATETAEDPLARAMSLAKEIAGKNPHAIRAAKRLSNSLADSTDEALLLAESAEQTEIIGKPNQVEAVMSQMEGRAAAYPDSP